MMRKGMAQRTLLTHTGYEETQHELPDRGRTSGAMYSGVPQAVLHREPATSSLEYPKSHILMMGSGWLPSSSTLSSCNAMRTWRKHKARTKGSTPAKRSCAQGIAANQSRQEGGGHVMAAWRSSAPSASSFTGDACS